MGYNSHGKKHDGELQEIIEDLKSDMRKLKNKLKKVATVLKEED